MSKLCEAVAVALRAIEDGETFDYLEDVIAPILRTALAEPQEPIHCVVLTSGEMDDYNIQRVYLSDHPINQEEWDLELYSFKQVMEQARQDIYAKHGGRYGYDRIPKAHEEVIAFMHANHPLPHFIKKHKLTPINYVEVWSWGHELGKQK